MQLMAVPPTHLEVLLFYYFGLRTLTAALTGILVSGGNNGGD